jgi:hypothetical protein
MNCMKKAPQLTGSASLWTDSRDATRAEGGVPKEMPGHDPGIAGAGFEPATPAL